MITINCPHCNAEGEINAVSIPPEGKRLRCPRCRNPFTYYPPDSPTAAALPLPAAPVTGTLRLLFSGDGGSLFRIQFTNIILTILTLSFYRFWGKVKVRNYLYGETELGGDVFEYHGNGKELLIGWIKAMAVLGTGYVFITVLQLFNPLFGILMTLAIPPMIGFAKVGSMRYRLSRSSWRGIRFSFRGTFREGINIYISGTLLTMLTLGLYYPFFHVKLRRFLIENSCYGNRRFTFNGEGKDLFLHFLLAIFLLIPTLGLYWFWFKARMKRYDWDRTYLRPIIFSSSVTGRKLLSLAVTNMLLFVFTLGLATPWIIVRKINFKLNNISLNGDFSLNDIRQDGRTAKAGGEELSDYLDIDGAVLDIGII